jgi:hypothetical protein
MGVVPLPIYKVGGQLKNYLRCHHCVKAGVKNAGFTARKLDLLPVLTAGRLLPMPGLRWPPTPSIAC